MGIGNFIQFSVESVTDGCEILYGIIACEEGEAEGWDIVIDKPFLDSLVELGNSRPIKLRVNHPSDKGDVLSIIGEAKAFRHSITARGDKLVNCVRCDAYLSDVNDADTKKIITLANKTPHLFGMSIAGKYDVRKEIKGGKKLCILSDLSAVDFVDRPAATHALLSQPVDSTITNEGKKVILDNKTPEQLLAEAKADAEKKEKEAKLEAILTQLPNVLEWAKKRMEAEEKEDKDKEKEKKDKEAKMEAEKAKNTITLERKDLDEMFQTKATAIAMEVLAKCGVTEKTPSNPDGEGKTGENKLSAEETKIAQSIGLTKPEDLKQFAANMKRAKDLKLVA